MVNRALRRALMAPETPEMHLGELAGSAVMELAETRGLETNSSHRIYDSCVNLAALADILVTAIRKPGDEPWACPEPVQNWTSSAFLSPDGNFLRRVVLVSHWSDERKISECRSWFSLGECAHYGLPMQTVVCIIGQMKDGLRRGPWTQGFLHPRNKALRFRKKSRETTEVFNDRWIKIFREDHAEISRERWLQAMLVDDVLPEVMFRVDIPLPESSQRQRVLDLARRKMDRLQSLKRTPEACLSVCDFPVPCQFRRLCHGEQEREPSEKTGYISANDAPADGLSDSLRGVLDPQKHPNAL